MVAAIPAMLVISLLVSLWFTRFARATMTSVATSDLVKGMTDWNSKIKEDQDSFSGLFPPTDRRLLSSPVIDGVMEGVATSAKSISDSFRRRLPIFALLVLYASSGTVYVLGQIFAAHQQTFLVANAKPEAIVVRVYGDKLICAALDRQHRSIYGTFFLLKVGDGTVKLTSEKLGRLAVAHMH